MNIKISLETDYHSLKIAQFYSFNFCSQSSRLCKIVKEIVWDKIEKKEERTLCLLWIIYILSEKTSVKKSS